MSSTGNLRAPQAFSLFFLGFLFLLFGVAAAVVEVLKPFFAAIAWAVVLAVAFQTPWRWFERKLAGRSGAAAAIFSLGVGLLVILPAGILGATLVKQAAGAAQSLQGELRTRHVGSLSDVARLPTVERGVAWVVARTGVKPENLWSRVGDYASSLSSFIAQTSAELVKGFFNGALTFLMTIFLLFFLLRDGEAMKEALVDIVPLEPARRDAVVSSLGRMLGSIFRGSFLCAVAQGTAGGVGWAIAGLPSPTLAGAVMAVLSMLPVGGTALVWLPGTIWCWVDGRPGAAVFLAAWGAAVVSFLADNILKPMLIGGTAELSTLVVFLGVFGGIPAYGLLGLFIGPIALALGLTLLDVLRDLVKAERGDPGGAAAA